MKLLLLILPALILSCLNRSNYGEGHIPSSEMLDGKVWMTENLNVQVPGSFCQQDDSLLCKQYGRLYTWESAIAGCQNLGTGWRLPTNEEWHALAKSYGGIYNESADQGKYAYTNLSPG